MRELEELCEQLRRIEHKLTDEERKRIQDRLECVREGQSLLDEKYLEAIRDRSVVHSLLERTSEDLLNQYRAIFENAGSAMVVVDRDGMISLTNSGFEELAGLPRNQLENMRRFAEVADDELITLVERYQARDEKDGSEVLSSGEGQITGVNGMSHDVYLRIGLFPETGQCVLSILDITARKRAEDALKMVNRKLTLLSSITRHDISNQIMVIDGFLNLIHMRFSEPEIIRISNKIESASRNIRNQIEFTKAYENLGKNEPQWQAVQQALPFQPVPERIKTDYLVEGLSIYADPMIGKVFFNLLDNSIRHGGHVSKICLSYTESLNGLTIAWEDDGVGVPIGDKEQIFERGFGKNTGLGLFLVREILSLTGMSIRETGMEGVGVRFEILVPKGSYRFDAQ